MDEEADVPLQRRAFLGQRGHALAGAGEEAHQHGLFMLGWLVWLVSREWVHQLGLWAVLVGLVWFGLVSWSVGNGWDPHPHQKEESTTNTALCVS